MSLKEPTGDRSFCPSRCDAEIEVCDLVQHGETELRDIVHESSQQYSTLSKQLRKLERNGIIARHNYSVALIAYLTIMANAPY